jgi:hypothetical protein
MSQHIVDGCIALIPFADANLTSIFEQREVVIVTEVGNRVYMHQAPGFSLLAILRLALATLICVCKRSL